MSVVHIKCTVPAVGGETAADGFLEWRPTKRLNLTDGGARVLLPASMIVSLVNGEATVAVEPNDETWVWRVIERAPGGAPQPRYLSVPDSEFTLEYAELTMIDPETLEPVSEHPTIAASLALKVQTTDLDDATALRLSTPGTATRLAINEVLDQALSEIPGGGTSAVVTTTTMTTPTGSFEFGDVVTILGATSSGAGRVRLYLSAGDRTALTNEVYDWSPTGLQVDPGDPFTVHTTDSFLYWLLDGGLHINLTFITLA